MVDPWKHGTVNPVYSDVDNYFCPIAVGIAGGECGAAKSVASVSEIRAAAKNPAC
jgi:F0F1-type ATP synthase membrane subunit c/vacuolar-type H+-ATPase subunit K